MSQDPSVTLGLNLQRFRVLEFSLSSHEPPAETLQVAVGMRQDLALNPAADSVALRMEIQLDASAEGQRHSARLKVEGQFQVRPLAEFISSETECRLPLEVVRTLSSVVDSTARGVLLAQATGSFLARVLLPLVSPAQLVPEESPGATAEA